MNDEKVATELAEVKQAILTQTDKVGELVTHVKSQNNRIGTLETTETARAATEIERHRWEEKRERDLKWLYFFGLGMAGLLSGIVFQVMERL